MSVEKVEAELYLKNKKQQNKSKKKYGYMQREHAKMGKLSCYLAGGAFAVLCAAVAIAFFKAGEAGVFVGGLGACSLILAFMGIKAAIKGKKEKEKRQLTCNLGVVFNLLLLVGLVFIYIR